MRSFTDFSLLDQKVCQLASAIETNLIAYITPQNLIEEKKKFFEHLAKHEPYNPIFTYLPRNLMYSYFKSSPNFATYRNELKELLTALTNPDNETLALIFEKKIQDLFDRMDLLRSVGTQNFAGNSESYYGTVDHATLSYAREFLNKKFVPEEETISFETAKQGIEAFLKKKHLHYKVVQRESGGSKFAVNVRTKEVLISKHVRFSPNSLKRLIAHEIEGHIYRYENGVQQPYQIFARGLSKETLETEEGIAVVVEQKENIDVAAQLKEYSGRVLAIATAATNSFYHTYEELTNYFTPEEAFTLTLRAKRGTWQQDTRGAFTKDIAYLKGMLLVEEFLKDQRITDLYYGRYSINDTPLVLDVAGLNAPKYLPEYLSK